MPPLSLSQLLPKTPASVRTVGESLLLSETESAAFWIRSGFRSLNRRVSGTDRLLLIAGLWRWVDQLSAKQHARLVVKAGAFEPSSDLSQLPAILQSNAARGLTVWACSDVASGSDWLVETASLRTPVGQAVRTELIKQLRMHHTELSDQILNVLLGVLDRCDEHRDRSIANAVLDFASGDAAPNRLDSLEPAGVGSRELSRSITQRGATSETAQTLGRLYKVNSIAPSVLQLFERCITSDDPRVQHAAAMSGHELNTQSEQAYHPINRLDELTIQHILSSKGPAAEGLRCWLGCIPTAHDALLHSLAAHALRTSDTEWQLWVVQRLAQCKATRDRDALLLDFAFHVDRGVASLASNSLFACETLRRRETVLPHAKNLLRAPVDEVRTGARQFVEQTFQTIGAAYHRGVSCGETLYAFVEESLSSDDDSVHWMLKLTESSNLLPLLRDSICIGFRSGNPKVVSYTIRLIKAGFMSGEVAPDDAIIARLRGLLEHSDDRVRADAIETLSQILPEQGVERRFFDDGCARVRANALAAALSTDAASRGIEQSEEAALCLQQMLTDRRSGHRLSACWVASRLGSRGIRYADSLAALAQRERDPAVQSAAVRAARSMVLRSSTTAGA